MYARIFAFVLMIYLNLDISKQEFFIIGDFNIDISKKTSEESKDLINMMLSFSFKQFVKEPTRYGRNTTCIDLI